LRLVGVAIVRRRWKTAQQPSLIGKCTSRPGPAIRRSVAKSPDPMPGVEYVTMDEIRNRPLQVAVSPLLSLFMAVRDAAGAERSGTPEPWCEAIRAHLTRRDYDVLAPLVTSERTFVPRAILPFPEAPGDTLKEGLERIIAAEHDLNRDISTCVASGRAGDWREPARDPRRWIRGFVLAMARAWNGFSPVWRNAQDELARETERVAVAAARDSRLDLLATLLPDGRVREQRWEIDGFTQHDMECRLPHDGLVVIPLVSGSRASIVDHDDAVMRNVAYSLPVLRASAPAPRAPASLEALLGIPRARILRALERPSSNVRLAEVLCAAQSAASYHVTALEAAGLVRRVRGGRRVTVRRTERGDALLALYEAA
jgi:DNA-binding transcriptional ArsR family regulator